MQSAVCERISATRHLTAFSTEPSRPTSRRTSLDAFRTKRRFAPRRRAAVATLLPRKLLAERRRLRRLMWRRPAPPPGRERGTLPHQPARTPALLETSAAAGSWSPDPGGSPDKTDLGVQRARCEVGDG